MIKSIDYYYGNGRAINKEKSKKLCLKSDSKGNKLAKGMREYFGWDTIEDKKNAFHIFNEIKNDKNFEKEETSYSLFFLALIYENGEGGIQKDIDQSIKLYKQSANLGN